MIRPVSLLFVGPAEQGGKQMAEPAEEASTAPGSERASDGASLPTDDASDVSVEESPICRFNDLTETAPGAAEPGIENERADDRGGRVVDPQPPARAKAPQGDAEAPDTVPALWPAADRACAADRPASDARTRRAPPFALAAGKARSSGQAEVRAEPGWLALQNAGRVRVGLRQRRRSQTVRHRRYGLGARAVL